MIECVHITEPLTDIDAIRLLGILKERWGVFKITEAAYEKCLTGGYLVLNSDGDYIFGFSVRPTNYNLQYTTASSLLQPTLKYNKDLK